MKKDREIKKFITVTALILCVFSLFAGVTQANANTERTVLGSSVGTVNETDVINGVKRFLNEIKL